MAGAIFVPPTDLQLVCDSRHCNIHMIFLRFTLKWSPRNAAGYNINMNRVCSNSLLTNCKFESFNIEIIWIWRGYTLVGLRAASCGVTVEKSDFREVTFHWPEASNDNVFHFNVLAQKLINLIEQQNLQQIFYWFQCIISEWVGWTSYNTHKNNLFGWEI